MKKFVFILLAIVSFSVVSAQEDDILFSNTETSDDITRREDNPLLLKGQKPQFQLEFGTGVQSYLNGSSTFYKYAAPMVRYRLNPRVSIRAGLIMLNMNMNDYYMYGLEGFSKYSGNITQSYFYTAVDYMATEKLRISGEVIFGSGLYTNSSKRFGQTKIYTIGADYKVNEYLQIGVKFRKVEDNSPFYTSPVNRYDYSRSFPGGF